MSSLRALLLATVAVVGGVAMTPTESQATWYRSGGYYGGYGNYGGYRSNYGRYGSNYRPYYGGYRGGYRGGYYGNNYGYGRRGGVSIYTPYGGFSYRSGRRW